MNKGPLLLTGASGWFGRTALHVYEQEHGPEALRSDVIPYASCERLVDFGSPHGPVKAFPLEQIRSVDHPRGLLHLAFLTRDRVDELGLEPYVAANRAITAEVADVLRAWPSMPVVTTSSGAAAALDGRLPDVQGNPYASLKQEEEQLLRREASARLAVVFRVYAASGRFMTRPETFALGDFIQQALEKQCVRVRAEHEVWRSYVSTELLMRLCWRLLERGSERPGLQLLDACGEAVELADVAAAVALALKAELVPRSLDKALLADHYVGDGQAFSTMLQRHGLQPLGLQEQILETIGGLRLSS